MNEPYKDLPPAMRLMLLGQELKQAREQRRLRLVDVAVVLECSATKLSRLESGKGRVFARDMRDLAKVYFKDDEELQQRRGERWAEMGSGRAVRDYVARRRGRTNDPVAKGIYEAQRLEAAASTITIVGGNGFGALQTARAMAAMGQPSGARPVRAVEEAQLERIEQLAGTAGDVEVFIDEAAILRLGGPEAEAQLSLLKAFGREVVRVVPVRQGSPELKSLEHLVFGGTDVEMVLEPSVARELEPQQLTDERASDVAKYVLGVRSAALSAEASSELIEAAFQAVRAGRQVSLAATTGFNIEADFGGRRHDLEVADLFERLTSYVTADQAVAGSSSDVSHVRSSSSLVESLAAVAACFRVSRVDALQAGRTDGGSDVVDVVERISANSELRRALVQHPEGAEFLGDGGTAGDARALRPSERSSPVVQSEAASSAERAMSILQVRLGAPGQSPAHTAALASLVDSAAKFAADVRVAGRDIEVISRRRDPEKTRRLEELAQTKRTAETVPAYREALREAAEQASSDGWLRVVADSESKVSRSNVERGDEGGNGRDTGGSGGTRPDPPRPTVTGPSGGARDTPKVEEKVQEQAVTAPADPGASGNDVVRDHQKAVGPVDESGTPPMLPASALRSPPLTAGPSVVDVSAVPELSVPPTAPTLPSEVASTGSSGAPMARQPDEFRPTVDGASSEMFSAERDATLGRRLGAVEI